MRVLGIETSTRIGSVALVSGGDLVFEYAFGAIRSHAERLMEECSRAFRGARFSPGDIDGIAVSIGPGSFTGLRIGVAAAKALAYVLQVPIVGVTSLETLAYAVYDGQRKVYALIVARASLVYCGSYDGRLLSGPMVLPITEFLDSIRRDGEEAIFVGDGALYHESAIRGTLEASRIHIAGPMHSYPRAGVVAYLGVKKLESGVSDDVFTLVPAYSQKSLAEAKWERERDRAAR